MRVFFPEFLKNPNPLLPFLAERTPLLRFASIEGHFMFFRYYATYLQFFRIKTFAIFSKSLLQFFVFEASVEESLFES